MRRNCLRLLALLVGLGLTAPLAHARGGSHPYFDDQGTLTWYHSLAEAKAAAAREGKVIFVEYGRRRCTQCRVVVSRILPDGRVRSRLSKVAVGLVAECDRPEPTVDRVLRRNLRNANMLPFCGFLSANGDWITGFAGGTSVDAFLGYLRKAEVHACGVCTPPPAPKVETRRRTRNTPHPRPRPAPPQERTKAAVPPCPTPPPAERTRPPAPPRYPRPSLQGDPDAADVAGTSSCGAPPILRRPTGPLPPPRIILNPPVKVSRSAARRSPAASTGRKAPARRRSGDGQMAVAKRAGRAAERGRWGEVLRLSGEAPSNGDLRSLRNQAHEWAHAELRRAVNAVAETRFQEALEAVKVVLVEMQGQPEAIDAERGVMAIRTLLELRHLDPQGEVAKVVRQNTFEELRGTRWAILFS